MDGMSERIGQKGVELDKYLQTAGGGFGADVPVIVMCHGWGRLDIPVLEGKYKDFVQY